MPFAGPLEVVIFHTINTPPPPLRNERPAVSAELERICLKALSKKADERYASCREMAKDLGRWLAGRSTSLDVEALPASAGTARARRRPIEHRAGLDGERFVGARLDNHRIGACGTGTEAHWRVVTSPFQLPGRRWFFAAAVLLVSLMAPALYLASISDKATIHQRENLPRAANAHPSTDQVAELPEMKKLKVDAPEAKPASVLPATITNSIGMNSVVDPATPVTTPTLKPKALTNTTEPSNEAELITTRVGAIKLKRIPAGTFLIGLARR